MVNVLTSDIALFDRFEAIRLFFLSSDNPFIPLALLLASILCLVYFIKLGRDIMGDDKNAGFGTVTLEEVLRPAFMIAIIVSFQPLIRTFDGLLSGISTRMTMISEDYVNSADLREKLMNVADYVGSSDNIEAFQETSRAYGQGEVSHNSATALAVGGPLLEGSTNMFESVINNIKSARLSKKLLRDNGGDAENWRPMSKLLGSYYKMDQKAQSDMGWVSRLLHFIYEHLFTIIVGFSQVFLCVLAIFGPFVFVVSIVPSWKDAWKGWVAKYIELSLWQVIGSLVVMVTGYLCSSLYSVHQQQILDAASAIMEGGPGITVAEANGLGNVFWTELMLVVVGIVSLFAVPSITSQLLNLSSGGPLAGASEGASVARGVATMPANMVKGGISLIK